MCESASTLKHTATEEGFFRGIKCCGDERYYALGNYFQRECDHGKAKFGSSDTLGLLRLRDQNDASLCALGFLLHSPFFCISVSVPLKSSCAVA
eukprot:6464861-Amphidinium_carterae.1